VQRRLVKGWADFVSIEPLRIGSVHWFVSSSVRKPLVALKTLVVTLVRSSCGWCQGHVMIHMLLGRNVRSRSARSNQGLYIWPNSVDVVTNHLEFLLSILKELCRRDARDSILCWGAATLININWCENKVLVAGIFAG
jgi:hypothetical protein